MNYSSHPIHQANQDSPYGDLTRDDFYKKHRILHHEMFMLNNHNMSIFTQTWCLDSSSSYIHLKGIVAMVHGYMSESSWLNELTAIAIARAGFLVCALDLQGHGRSDGVPGYMPSIDPLVDDCIQYFDSIKSRNPDLPAFLYGESLGGAISILICLKQKQHSWQGLILNGAMCGFAPAFYKPVWPLEKILPIVKVFAKLLEMLLPTKKLVNISKQPMANRFYKEKWKRTLVRKSPNRRTSAKPKPTTALEFLRVTEYIKSHAHEVDVPALLVLHGEEDRVCDYTSARLVYESASSKDKSLKIFAGMWHMLIGEHEENVELVFGTVLSWLKDHTNKAVSLKANN